MRTRIRWLRAATLCLLTAPACLAPLVWSQGAPAPRESLEPYAYREDFEANELNAWASYPLWQDTAFDPNFHVGRLVPGDTNISIIERVTPYTDVDNYAGAQKKLDAFVGPDSVIGLRYYLKTELKPEFFKVRIARKEGPLDFTVVNPPTNRWETLSVSFADLAARNAEIAGRNVPVTGLAFLAKFPKADPAMPIYLGLDDIVFKGSRVPDFRFAEPAMHKLDEWRPYIPQRLFERGDELRLRGEWPVAADGVTVRITSFTERDKVQLSSRLKRIGREWRLAPVRLNWAEGLYHGELAARRGRKTIDTTEFTIFIAPRGLAGKHPRLWFDSRSMEAVKQRLLEDRFRTVRERMSKSAREAREALPLDKFSFDINVFPKDEPLLGNVPRSIYPWFDRIRAWRAGVHDNALAYALLDDQEAGRYAAGLLVKLCSESPWLHPWFESRGQHIYYPVGELGMDVALGYDLVFDLLDEAGRKAVKQGLWRNVVVGCHRSYVEDNLVTSNTSNWVDHITGGSIMSQAATFGDVPGGPGPEPYLTGVLLKLYEVIQKSSGRDGGYGESYGYCSFTMESLAKALPSLDNVFHIDFSATLDRTYQDVPWASLLENRFFFYFGDSSGDLGPMTNWAWLLARRQDPLLGWLYGYLKKGETLMDAIYEPEKAPRRDPFGENPVRLYRDIGTTVFRSGWTKDDFLFVMRTGPFYNHQHLDQGTFWLADRGSTFIAERHGSTYYDDPNYQSHYIQPIAHSTILIDRNEQSQRVGDPLAFIPGLEDHAFVHQFLDGGAASFVSGDIAGLYWGNVAGLRRNVLYLKPRTLLMLDTVVPADKDVAVTLLYQAGMLADISAGRTASFVRKGQSVLRIAHLWPPEVEVRTEETPLYINTLKTEKPLEREGLLAVTARTAGKPLVMANLLGTAQGGEPALSPAKGCVYGKLADAEFVFSTEPGEAYENAGWKTDAVALTWSEGAVFAALCTFLGRDGVPILRSDAPLTFEHRAGRIKFGASKPTTVSIALKARPRAVTLDGRPVTGQVWDSKNGELKLTLPAGEGTLTF
jgi:hypothetical protein